MPAPVVNAQTLVTTDPSVANFGSPMVWPKQRLETESEKSARMTGEENNRRGVDERNVDVVLEWMNYARDIILAKVEESS